MMKAPLTYLLTYSIHVTVRAFYRPIENVLGHALGRHATHPQFQPSQRIVSGSAGGVLHARCGLYMLYSLE